jgi:hypothetical protein
MARPVDPESIRSVAKRLGRHVTQLRRAIRDGLVDVRDLERSAIAWNAQYPKVERPAPTTATGEARRRLEVARAEKQEIQVRQLKGELIDRAGVTRLFFETGKAVREKLEQWPARAAAPLAAKLGKGIEPHTVENLLAEEVNNLLFGIVEQLKREF